MTTKMSRILVAQDQEGQADEAVRLADRLAQAFGGELHVAHVVELTRRPWAHADPLKEDDLRRLGGAVTGRVQTKTRAHIHHRQGQAVPGVLAVADEVKPDLLIMGRRHEGLLDSFIGGTTVGVLRRIPCPVLVHKAAGDALPSRLLACVDLSEDGERSLRTAVAWAGALSASVRVLYVFEPPAFCYEPAGHMPTYAVEHIQEDEVARLQALVKRTEFHAIPHEVRVEVGPAGPTIVESANEGTDLVVVGSHGRTAWDRIFLGSVSEYVVKHGTASVLVVPGPKNP
jgi:nucleotide-binding universal stress UspA family protein